MRTDSPARPYPSASSGPLASPASSPLPSGFTMVAVSSAEMLKRLQAGLLKGVKPCVYNPANHTLRLLVAG